MALLTDGNEKHGQGDNALWIVQKFGGTSIGKYPLNIVQNVVRPALRNGRVVLVCSARSNNTKSEGTTNRLLQAYRHCLKGDSDRFEMLIQTIRAEHINAAYGYIKNPKIAADFATEIDNECWQTMLLLEAIQTIGHGSSHTKDRVISTGERLASRFLCAVLRDQGISCDLIDFSNILANSIQDKFDQSLFDVLSTAMAEKVACCKATVPVVTGFFGPVDGGLLAGFGRGYTDLCASLLSIGLQAHDLQIWKEVDGIFTADPRKVPGASMIPVISFEEASELTFHGSEVVHFTAMRLAMRAKIPMHIKNVMNPKGAGTLIRDDYKSIKIPTMLLSESFGSRRILTSGEVPRYPLAITSKDSILLINIRSAERLKPHKFFAGIFSVLDHWNLSIDLICTCEVHVSLALHSEVSLITGSDEDDSEIVRKDLKSAITQLQDYGHVELLPNMAVVSVVGKEMRRAPGVAGKMFSVLGENNINVEMIAQGASEISISCVLDERDIERAVGLLHARLFTNLSNASSEFGNSDPE